MNGGTRLDWIATDPHYFFSIPIIFLRPRSSFSFCVTFPPYFLTVLYCTYGSRHPKIHFVHIS